MARKARVRAKSGVYHVVIQSASHKEFFRDEEDYLQFVLTLTTKMRKDTEDGKDLPSCALYAYCLLPSHVHLLIKEDLEDISMILKRIGSSYVHYYNRKYGNDGTLFKGRFKSEPVEDETRLQELIGYIHQNPLWHGVAQDWGRYGYSSLHEYVGKESALPMLCKRPEGLLQMQDEELQRLMAAPVAKQVQAIEAKEPQEPKPSDAQVWILIMKLVGVSNRTDFQGLPDATRRETLVELRKRGASVRQLERLTGIGRGVIQYL